MNRQIPMLDLNLEYMHMKKDIDAAIEKCLEHQRWILGPEVKEFEEKTASYLGAGFCVGASSGTDSLVIALRALAIRAGGDGFFSPGDEVITTPFTFTATGDAILRAGATPVFVDIDEDMNISVEQAIKYMEGSNRVKGIVPVHLFGRPCEMEGIMSAAGERGLFVVEDAAQAFGGEFNGRKLGSIGDFGSFSFFPSKNLGGFGDAGMVSTSDNKLAECARMLTKHGGRDKYDVRYVGYNARLDTLQAAVLIAKLKYIDEFNGRRAAAAAFYNSELSGVDGIELPSGPAHVYHQYTIKVGGGRRDDLQRFLQDRGISTMVYYKKPLHEMDVFKGRSITAGPMENTEAACGSVLSLPIEPLFEVQTFKMVAVAVREFFG